MNWKKVQEKCMKCKQKVGDIKIERDPITNIGKIVIKRKFDNFGSFVQEKGKAHMKVICRTCQRLGSQ